MSPILKSLIILPFLICLIIGDTTYTYSQALSIKAGIVTVDLLQKNQASFGFSSNFSFSSGIAFLTKKQHWTLEGKFSIKEMNLMNMVFGGLGCGSTETGEFKFDQLSLSAAHNFIFTIGDNDIRFSPGIYLSTVVNSSKNVNGFFSCSYQGGDTSYNYVKTGNANDYFKKSETGFELSLFFSGPAFENVRFFVQSENSICIVNTAEFLTELHYSPIKFNSLSYAFYAGIIIPFGKRT